MLWAPQDKKSILEWSSFACKNQQKILKIYFHRLSSFVYTGVSESFSFQLHVFPEISNFSDISLNSVKMERACTFRREKTMNVWHFPKGIFGEYETENYKFGFIQLAVTPASFSLLTTIGFIQYCRHKSHFKIQFFKPREGF